jgi:acetyl esterase/lipase
MILAAVTSIAFLIGAPDDTFRKETVVYARPEDEALNATLYIPASESKELRPAVVLIHGGAWVTGTRRQVYWYGRHLAEEGYVAMSVDYRTMPGAPFPAPLFDVKAAVRWLRKNAEQYRIDPKRIAAMGTSAGGHLALMLALTPNEKELEGTENLGYPCNVEAAVSLYGPTDLKELFAQKEKGRFSRYTWGPLVKEFAGRKEFAGKDPLDAASPVSYVGPHTPPILCIHGTSDEVVPVEQSRKFFDKLKDAGADTQCIEVPGYSHAFDYLHPSVRRELFPKILDFLKRSLKESGGEKDAESKRR